ERIGATIMAPTIRWRPGWRTLAVLVLVLLFGALALRQIGDLLRAMHEPGRPSYGFGSLAHVTAGPSSERTADVLRVWREYAAGVDVQRTTAFEPVTAPTAV